MSAGHPACSARFGRRAFWLVALLGCGLAFSGAALADRIHLRSGGTIEVHTWWTENDTILRPSGADLMPAFIADLERHIVRDCGHWTQQEKPDEFNRVVLDWLRRKFLAV